MKTILIFVSFLFFVVNPAFAQAPPPPAVVTAITESDAVHAGETARLALQVDIPQGLHAQANHPIEPSLIAMQLFIDAPAGVTYKDVTFPKPENFTIAGTPALVFTGRILIGARVAIAADHAAGPLTLAGRLRYQACDDRQCFFPRTIPVSWTLRVVAASEPVTARAGALKGIDFARAEAVPQQGDGSRPVESAPAKNSSEANPLQLLDKFEVAGTQGGYLTTSQFLQFLHDAESGQTRRGPFEGRGPLAILALVFVGGLALNLTPCVLPMIPINLAIIGAGAQSKKRSRGFGLGAAYGAAMALVYGVLGLVVILTAGTFGTINSTVWFNAAIAALFVVLGLAMFDVVSIDFSRWSSRVRFGAESRGTFLLAFSMGAVAALLAGACVAPVVIQVVVFASNLYARGSSIALALPFFLGLGMALPWPLAGAGMASLPKPGAWMVRVKQVMGVFILATAAYYGYLAYEIVANRSVDPASVKASVDEQIKNGWNPSLAGGLQTALAQRTPVLIDFWATWCKNCLVMDETTLKDPAVKAALAGYTRIKFQAEDLDAPPASELMKRVGGVGLPTYAILKPKP